MTLVDTNVLLDLLTDDPVWYDWSLAELDKATLAGSITINDVIYAELAGRFDASGPLDEFVDEVGLEFAPMPRAALFLASKAFARYRSNRGTRTGVLSDFFIGAHAATLKVPILTRDVTKFRTYFPEVRLIAPPVN